ncbi:Aste57867_19377 [Aphanomyces stellatus]|uniref:Aste57867_19377 protein n=1 Tax=Aphanomyces stellatus TaxID=120398 RepID=A0A485LCK0_9STRA|nr:hypothetical protein As57867_019313 [Aphanomyces stellatus]VFT96091.1 Aste57867_19377 [Aphanomyces stellatus]
MDAEHSAVDTRETSTMMHLNLKFMHEEAISLTVERDIGILTLKQRIFDTTGTPVAEQRLIYKGKVLRDQMYLYNYNFIEGDTIHVVAAPRPSTSTASAPPSAEQSTQSNSIGSASSIRDTSPRNDRRASLHSIMDALLGSDNSNEGRRAFNPRNTPFVTMTFGNDRPSNAPPSRSTSRRENTTPQALLEQAIHLRQAATRLSHLPMISLHPHEARLASSLNEFSHSLLLLSRQVSSLAWALNRLDSEDDVADPAIQSAITETMQLLRELGAFATPLREALANLVQPPPSPPATIALNIIRIPTEERQPETSTGNIILTLLQAVGNAVRGAREVAAAPPSPPPAPSPTSHPSYEESHETGYFSNARTPLLGSDTPLIAVLDVVYNLMEGYFVPPQALHVMSEEFVASLHRPLQRVLETALGFSNEVEPPQLPKRMKAWAKAAARQYEGWLADVLLAESQLQWSHECADGVHVGLFLRLLHLVLLPLANAPTFASDMQHLGRRFLSALLYALLNVPMDTHVASEGLIIAILQRLVVKTTDAARDNGAVTDDGMRVIRHVLLSVARDQAEVLFTRTLAVTQESAMRSTSTLMF